MITGHVFIAASLNGYIARDDGDIGWLHSVPTEGEDHGNQDFMASVDALIMGRETFRKVLEFEIWPYSKPMVVMSRSLRQQAVPSRLLDMVHVSALSPDALMHSQFAKGWKRAYIDGGQLIQSFMTAGLIEDLIITRIPILLGRGRTLFGPLPSDVRLDHIRTTAFPSGLVQSMYRVRSNP